MSQCHLRSFLQGSLDQRKHPGASFKLALWGMGFDVWQGWGLCQGLWEFVEETQLQRSFWSLSQQKVQHHGNLLSFSLPFHLSSPPLPSCPPYSLPSPFLTVPVSPHRLTFSLCFSPLLFPFPSSTLFSFLTRLCHIVKWHQTMSGDSTHFYFLFKIVMTCLFSPCEYAKLLQSRLILRDPMVCSLPDSSVHGILQARILEWVSMPSSSDLPNPGIKSASLMSPALAGGLFTHLGSPFSP